MLLIWAGMMSAMACSGGNQVREAGSPHIPVMASLDSSFVLKYNQNAIIEYKYLKIKFTNVVEDSRCPVGVICIWPGQAKIELEIKPITVEPEIITLTSLAGQDELAEQRISGYTIKLLKVEPPKTKDHDLKLTDYFITLMVSADK